MHDRWNWGGRLRAMTAMVLAMLMSVSSIPYMGSVSGLSADGDTEATATRYVVGFHTAPENLSVGDVYNGATVYHVEPTLRMIAVETTDLNFKPSTYADPDVRYVEPDVQHRALLTPDDPEYAEQYAPRQVHAEEAWDIHTGSTQAAVCVADSGVRSTHEDLAGARWLGGYDFVNDDPEPLDDHRNGHGTHVTGIAAAGLDNGKGIAGAANVGFYHVKVLDDWGFGSASDIASGIVWCADETGPRTVISLSFGTSTFSQAVQDAVSHAYHNRGKLVVGASGNGGCDNCVDYPARLPEVMAVSCTDNTESACSFHSTGPAVEIAAPGANIRSTCHTADNDYCDDSGTSMSAPLVSGMAALLWSYEENLTAEELRWRLQNATQDLGAPSRDPIFGFGELDALCLLEGRTPCTPPTNDAFAAAHTLDAMPFHHNQTNRGSGLDAGESAPCATMGASVWYRWTSTSQGTLTVSTGGSDFPTVLAVYTGSDVSDLQNLACDAATGGSAVQVDVSTGATYHFQMGGLDGETGNLSVEFTCVPDDCRPPDNDAFAHAAGLGAVPASRHQRTHGATLEIHEPQPCGEIDSTVWYTWTSPWSGTLSVDTFTSNFDTVLAAYEGNDLQDLTLKECNDDADSYHSQVQVTVTPGTTYHFQVGGHRGAAGDLQLNIQCSECTPGPANDDFTSPVVIERVRFAHGTSTVDATRQDLEPQPCGAIGATVWYKMTTENTEEVTVHTLESDFDTVLAVYTGTTANGLPGLLEVDCNDSADSVTDQSEITFLALEGVPYYIQAGGYAGKTGYLTLKARCDSCFTRGPDNDDRSAAKEITLTPFSTETQTADATLETNEPQPCGEIGSTVWYKYSPLLGGLATADTVGSDYDTVLAVYVDVGGILMPLGCNDDFLGGGLQSRVTFTALPGFTYYLQAGGYHAEQGNLTLNLT